MRFFEFVMETALRFWQAICVNQRTAAKISAVLSRKKISEGAIMPGNIFYIIGVVVVVLFILGYLGLR